MTKHYGNGLSIERRWSRQRLLAAFVMVSAVTSALFADVLHLKNGRRIDVDRYWENGDQLFCEKKGSIFGFPKSLLDHIERKDSQPPEEVEPAKVTTFKNETITSAIEDARQSVREGDLDKASRLYRQALSVAPDSITGRVELAELFIGRGNLQAAETQLEQAKRLSPNEPTVREKLGDVYHRRGRTALARREWQKALELSPSSDLLYKLKKALRENDQDIEFDEIRHAKYVIRYDGVVSEAIGRSVAAALDEEYADLAQEFHFNPQAPISVILYTHREFQDVTHAPSWISAVNDGQLRIPVEGMVHVTPKLRKLLRHELTHSFVDARTGGTCPTWFQEGLAQLRAGESPSDMYPTLKKARDNGLLLPLWSLEGTILHYTKDKVRLAYLESLAATHYIVARRNRSALVQILNQLAEQKTMNDTLRKVVGLDYQEFQTAWEADLDRYH